MSLLTVRPLSSFARTNTSVSESVCEGEGSVDSKIAVGQARRGEEEVK
jgi:hypothetical protein